MKLNEETLIKYSFLILLLGMPFGYKISGRFAISNIMQIISFGLIILSILREKNAKFVLGSFFAVIFMIISSIYAYIRYQSSIRTAHVLFFSLIFIYFSFFTLQIRRNREGVIRSLNEDFKIAIYFFSVLYLSMAVWELGVNHKSYSGYTFDDKSHTVIFFMACSFISLKVIEGKKKWIFSILFLILSFTTTSRLVFIFLIFYSVYVYWEIVKNFKGIKGKLLGICIAALIVSSGIYVLLVNQSLFSVFSRMRSNNISAQSSTNAHFMLIMYALKLKFENLGNFVLGIAPGGFGDVLAHSNVNFSRMQLVDSGVYRAIYAGTTPVHSSHFQIFLEFSIFYFLWYCKFIIEILMTAIKEKNGYMLCFFIPLMGATMFYSTHNEIVYYCILLFCYMNARMYATNIICKN